MQAISLYGLSFAIVCISLILLDSHYYVRMWQSNRQTTAYAEQSLHDQFRIVITPLNNILYNTNLTNLAQVRVTTCHVHAPSMTSSQHGLHHRLLHLCWHAPLIAGPMLLPLVHVLPFLTREAAPDLESVRLIHSMRALAECVAGMAVDGTVERHAHGPGADRAVLHCGVPGRTVAGATPGAAVTT